MPSKDRIHKNNKENNKVHYDAKRDDILLDHKDNCDSEKWSEHHADDYNNDLLASHKSHQKALKCVIIKTSKNPMRSVQHDRKAITTRICIIIISCVKITFNS